MGKILITTANGMFGRALTSELLKMGIPCRLMVRDRSKCTVTDSLAEIVQGDLDKPETLLPLLEGIDSVFLSTPMDDQLAAREVAVINASKSLGVKRIVKVHGAVKHQDALAEMHDTVLTTLKDSGMEWSLISPNSVMETSLLGLQPSIKYMNAIYGISGESRIGLVALKDIAEASAVVLTSEGHHGINYELTGPQSLNMFEVAYCFSKTLYKRVDYIDLTEESFIKMIRKNDKEITPERLEMEILCHLRAWSQGKADLVTGSVKSLTGREATSLADFISDNLDYFKKGMVHRLLALILRRMF